MLDKVILKYPVPEKSAEMTAEDAKIMAGKCL